MGAFVRIHTLLFVRKLVLQHCLILNLLLTNVTNNELSINWLLQHNVVYHLSLGRPVSSTRTSCLIRGPSCHLSRAVYSIHFGWLFFFLVRKHMLLSIDLNIKQRKSLFTRLPVPQWRFCLLFQPTKILFPSADFATCAPGQDQFWGPSCHIWGVYLH